MKVKLSPWRREELLTYRPECPQCSGSGEDRWLMVFDGFGEAKGVEVARYRCIRCEKKVGYTIADEQKARIF